MQTSTAIEILNRLINCEGPCGRICSYCPEEFDLQTIKECIEDLIKENYQLNQSLDSALHNLIEERAKPKMYED